MKTTKSILKAVMLTAALGLSTSTLVSCKKTYDCHCVKTAGGDEETEIKAKSESDAESECKAKQSNNSSTYKDCHLD